ncbi:MAG: phenylalanine--tRNA ligase subunit beta [Acholeplasmataceae bacterium]
MKILTNILKDFIEVPKNLYELTNSYIIEVDDYKLLNESKNLKTGLVLEVTKHPNADSLYLTKVDVGDNNVLDIICGASNVKKDMYVIVATPGAILPNNFKITKAKIRGIESSGMICSLTELGIDEKLQDNENQRGIYHFPNKVKLGINPLPLLGLDGNLIELDLTPNRGDLLSHLGFAYDLGAVLNKEIKLKLPNIKETTIPNDISVSIETNDCYKYDLRVMEVKIKESPWWLKNALINSDIRPINNVVDITNYILIKYGTPLHAFDYKKVDSKEIIVKSALKEEEVTTLDLETRKVMKGDILITNGKKPIALGGVMGLLNTMVDDNTNKIMLEAALFNPDNIKETSKRLGLSSDSSLRFERGIDEDRVRLGLEEATKLLIELADAKVYQGISSSVKTKDDNPYIKYDEKVINDNLNLNLSLNEQINILKRLNFEINLKEKLVKAPKYRKDIKILADLIEEIGRIYGFNNISRESLLISQYGKLSKEQKIFRSLRYLLSGLGLNEVINYSLISMEEAGSFTKFTNFKKVLKPMREDRLVLRTSLIPGLINNVSYHVARQINDLSFFEIGNLFKENEEPYLGVILHGNFIKDSWQKKGISSDFYVLKGILDNVLNSLNIEYSLNQTNDLTNMHPNIQGEIIYKNKTIGQIGKVHPNYLKNKDLTDVYVFEVNLNSIINHESKLTYNSYSKYPSIKRDLSFVVAKEYKVNEIINLIKGTNKNIITDVNLFDIYEGKLVKENFQSLAISIIFNDKTKTLEKEEIEKVLKSIKFRLEKTFKAEIRD